MTGSVVMRMKLSRPLIATAALTMAVAGAALAGVMAHATATKTTVKVTEREYRITLVGKPKVGVDRFVVKNTGTLSHGLVIAGPGVKKRIALLRPGKSAVLVVTLKAGKYTIWCPVAGHAALGMKTAVKVGAVATGSTGSSTSSSTTTGSAWG
jgi:uncharacterized cupredoxin-like copper-binding protein